MQKYFHYIWSIATKKDRAKLLLVVAVTSLIPFLELFGIGAVFSFITIVADPEIMNSSEWAIRIKEIFSIEGEQKFKGAQVMASDLRASISLVLAGLCAEGKTTINRVYHLDRGYEKIEETLGKCGPEINRFK